MWPVKGFLALVLFSTEGVERCRAFSQFSVIATATRLKILEQISPSTRSRKTAIFDSTQLGTNDEIDENKSELRPPIKDAFSGFKSAQIAVRSLVVEGFGTKAKNVAYTMSVGDVVVPLCANLDQRQSLANRGIYPGVDYKVCELLLNDIQVPSIDSIPPEAKAKVTAKIRPKYPLRQHLERPDWPVSVRPVVDVPLWLSETTYQAGTALGTLALAISYFSLASLLAFFIRITYVPSESMIPALNVGDVVLVTRPLPFFGHPRLNDVVLFDPPKELDDAIQHSKVGTEAALANVPIVSTKGKQLLKRVVAAPGDQVGVKNFQPYVIAPNGEVRIDNVSPYAHPEIFPSECWDRPPSAPLKQNEYFVAGDNGSRSVDSRVWGPMEEKYVIGTAQWVLYPPEHFGPVPLGPVLVDQ